MIYGFEALMTNEFHTLNGTCSTLVPSGPGYEQVPITNQVCTTVGSVAGQLAVDGNRYLDLSFTFRQSHLWRVSLPICGSFIIIADSYQR